MTDSTSIGEARAGGAPAVREDEPRAAYVHVPFCAHRCGYCDFTLVAGRDDLVGDYLRALEVELSSLQHKRRVQTLFLGGGTPTHLDVPSLERLTALLAGWFELDDGYEFSVEANPDGFSREKVDVLSDAGVNRISLGAQSFDAGVLKTLERDHEPADIEQAVDTVRERIDNVALDLIFGVPGQSETSWSRTLDRAVSLDVSHVSTYGLTIEKGTTFWSRSRKGQLTALPGDAERDMYAAAMDRLTAAGFDQYEISNFARSGFRCRHNETYWCADSYFGFGPGAARYLDGERTSNHRSVTTWIKRTLAGEPAVGDSERLSAEHRAREMAVLGLRMTEGVDIEEFEQRSGFDLRRLCKDAIDRQTAAGLVEQADGRLRLTREGRFLADSVVVDFL